MSPLQSKEWLQPRLIRRYTAILLAIWSLVVSLSYLWIDHTVRANLLLVGRAMATSAYDKDILYRHWAARQGGIYVPTDRTPPNPYLSHIPERDITTPSGIKLTLINPAYMLREVFESGPRDKPLILGHITSLNPLRPENSPDPWEAEALQAFDRGAREVVELVDNGDTPYLRFMRPFIVEDSCLKCHAAQGYHLGDLRGGISVSVPLVEQHAHMLADLRGIATAHALLWGLGLALILFGSRRLDTNVRRLHESEERFRTIAEMSAVAIYQTDAAGRCVYTNPLWQQHAGLTMAEAQGEGWLQGIHPDDRASVQTGWREMIATRGPWEQEYRFAAADRSTWVHGTLTPIFDEGGQITGYVGVNIDVTDRKAVEEKLRGSEHFLRTVIDSEPECVKLITLDGSLLMMNPAGLAMIEADSFSQVEGASVFNLVTEAYRQAFIDLTRQVFAGHPGILEFAAVGLKGRQIWLDTHAVPYRNDQGEVTALLSVTRDITARKATELELHRARQAAEAANRAKSEFLANMSHEIRTPMNGICGMTELLGFTELTKEQRQYADIIRSSTDDLLALISDILDLSKIEAEKLELETTPFSLRQVINGAIQLHRPRIMEKGLSLTLQIPDDIPDTLRGDPHRLKQVLLNLLSNALKFTSEGEVGVRLALHERTDQGIILAIAVNDTGIGIPADTQEQIFAPFVQADSSSTRKYGGTGLGLTICRRLCELMGGSIAVRSRAGVGSTFEVVLPFALEDQGVPAPATTPSCQLPPRDGSPLRVLLAEDNDLNAQYGMAVLSVLGHSATLAEDGEKALRIWEKGEVDLILMDIQMPTMNGREAMKIIRERERSGGHHTPIIALTAHALHGDRERMLAAGFDGYLAKPFEIQRLVAVMQEVLPRRK